MKLIGLIGKARVGKDTVGDFLRACHSFQRYAFADPIKTMLKAAFPDIDFDGGDREAIIEWLGKSPRHLMQTLGTEWGREQVHPDLWVLLADRKIVEVRENGLNAGLVVTDVRFRNEAELILARGGELWHVMRPGTTEVNDHVSEHADWTGVPRRMLMNDGTLNTLFRRVNDLLETSECSPA